MRRLLRSMILVLGAVASIVPLIGHAECQQIVGASGATTAILPQARADTISQVYGKLTRIAGGTPPLWVCDVDVIDAWTRCDPQFCAIVLYKKLLDAIGPDQSAIAFVLGHELGHLINDHQRKEAAVAIAVRREAISDWIEMVRRGGSSQAATATVIQNYRRQMVQFSRAEENEADDTGFNLAVRAGFDPTGARRVFEAFARNGLPLFAKYFDEHPGLLDRLSYSAKLGTNEEYRRKASGQLEGHDVAGLGLTVSDWRRDIPDSGAAAYYAALYELLVGGPTDRVSGNLEDSVSMFDGEGLSLVGQSYQIESSEAPVALCVSLYREDRKVQALNCLQELKNEGQIELFKKITGWTSFILVRPQREVVSKGRGISGARLGNDVALTNCEYLARASGLRPLKPWKGLRTPKSDAPPGEGALQCSPDFCDCSAEPLK